MTELIDPLAVYAKGLVNLNDLVGVERLVFMLQDFDNLMEMEGWNHFFIHDHHFIWYLELKEWLCRIGDEASLAVLADYEAHLTSRGFELSPSGVQELLRSTNETYSDSCPDWCGWYCELRDTRWAKASSLIESQGFKLEAADPRETPRDDGIM